MEIGAIQLGYCYKCFRLDKQGYGIIPEMLNLFYLTIDFLGLASPILQLFPSAKAACLALGQTIKTYMSNSA